MLQNLDYFLSKDSIFRVILDMPRPTLAVDIDPEIFDSYYWYRSELEAFAKLLGLSRAGGKFDIHDRISEFLRTGQKEVDCHLWTANK